jgi:hypothetical protein
MAAPPIAPPQRFVQEGLFLALPTGVPGWCVPLPPDECRITSLTHGPRCIYGVTAGPTPHVLAADYRGSVCYARSMGPVANATSLAGVAVTQGEHGSDRLFIAANTASGCVLLRTSNHPVDDVIQEPTFGNPPYEPALPALNATAHDVAAAGPDAVWVLTDDGIQRADVKAGTWKRVVDAKPATARRFLYRDAERVWYADANGQVWQLAQAEVKRTGLKLTGVLQTVGGARGLEAVPVVDGDGAVALLDLLHGTSRPAGQSPLPRVQALCAVRDGRIFGLCGDGIGAFFRVDPKSCACDILGAVVATVGVRRYGFDFSCAIPGQDGEIVFGECDRGGHVWLYYPRQN